MSIDTAAPRTGRASTPTDLPHWTRLGHVFRPDNSLDWMQDYATTPTALLLDDRIRVFFSTRGARDGAGNFVSQTTFVDVDRIDPTRVLAVGDRPLIDVGSPGSFDEFGIMVAEAVAVGDRTFLYYMGWQRTTTAPYLVQLGLAVADRDGTAFEKISEGPVLGVHRLDPWGIGNVCVRSQGERFEMTYTSFLPWTHGDDGWSPRYELRRATSDDGVDWEREDATVLAPTHPREALATPAIWRHGSRQHLWFSARAATAEGGHGAYRIGHAVADDDGTWIRDDRGGLGPGAAGWEREATCYPALIEVDGRLLAFYCGDGFGHTGFGVAEITFGETNR
ncbi:MAG: hypothetical protein AAFZ07_04740 [Actinomycetota bacterium]